MIEPSGFLTTEGEDLIKHISILNKQPNIFAADSEKSKCKILKEKLLTKQNFQLIWVCVTSYTDSSNKSL